MRLLLPCLAVLLPLAACGNLTHEINSNVEGVSYTFDGSKDGLEIATQRAQKECGRYGRVAVLGNTSEIDDEYVINFRCVNSNV